MGLATVLPVAATDGSDGWRQLALGPLARVTFRVVAADGHLVIPDATASPLARRLLERAIALLSRGRFRLPKSALKDGTRRF